MCYRTPLLRSVLVVGAVVLSMATFAQCRSFAKNKCVPELAPYKFNETFNSAQLAPGEEAEVSYTFYSGQDYRVMVCTHPILGEVNWKLVDQNNKIIFESLADDPKHHFDLKAARRCAFLSTKTTRSFLSFVSEKTTPDIPVWFTAATLWPY